MKKITRNWKIEKILEEYPDSVEVLVDYGFHCIGCALASFETLEQGAKAHGLKDKDIDELVDKLNNQDKKQSKSK